MTQVQQIKAEVERRYKLLQIGAHGAFRNGKIEALREVRDFINSLQAEPVSEDLEKEIHNKAMELHTAPTYDELRNFALYFVGWQKEKMLKEKED